MKKSKESLDHVFDVDEMRKIFSQFGVDLDSLNLLNLNTSGYHNYFEDITITPYRNNKNTEIKITGTYITYPADWHRNIPKTRGFFDFGGKMVCPKTEIKIDLVGKLL